jgi:hypothetical protein
MIPANSPFATAEQHKRPLIEFFSFAMCRATNSALLEKELDPWISGMDIRSRRLARRPPADRAAKGSSRQRHYADGKLPLSRHRR